MNESLKPLKGPVRSGSPSKTGLLRRSVGSRYRVTRAIEPWAAVGWQYKGGANRISKMLGAEYGNKRFPDPARVMQRTWNTNNEMVIQDFLVKLAGVVDDMVIEEAIKNSVAYQKISRVR